MTTAGVNRYKFYMRRFTASAASWVFSPPRSISCPNPWTVLQPNEAKIPVSAQPNTTTDTVFLALWMNSFSWWPSSRWVKAPLMPWPPQTHVLESTRFRSKSLLRSSFLLLMNPSNVGIHRIWDQPLDDILTIYRWGDSRIPGIGNSGDRWSAQKNWTVRYSCRTQGPQQHLTRATASQNASAPASPELPQA